MSNLASANCGHTDGIPEEVIFKYRAVLFQEVIPPDKLIEPVCAVRTEIATKESHPTTHVGRSQIGLSRPSLTRPDGGVQEKRLGRRLSRKAWSLLARPSHRAARHEQAWSKPLWNFSRRNVQLIVSKTAGQNKILSTRSPLS